MEIIFNLLIGFLIGILGYLIKHKKMYQLIAGLNYHPVKNNYKDTYNMLKVGNVLGNACFIYLFAVIISLILHIENLWIHLLATASMLIYIGIYYKSFKKIN